MKCLQGPFRCGNSNKHNRVLHIQHPTGSTGFYGISCICTTCIRPIVPLLKNPDHLQKSGTVSRQIFGPFKFRPPGAKTHFDCNKCSACTAAACIHYRTETCKTKFRPHQMFGQIRSGRIIAENKYAPQIC